jgi:hypothetical protein
MSPWGSRRRSHAELEARVRRVLHAEAGALGRDRHERVGELPQVVPSRRPHSRQRLYGAFAAGVAVAAAAGVAVALLLPTGRSQVTVVPASGRGQSISLPPSSLPPRGSSPPATVTPVPAGFDPLSVTFVSPDEGWVAGLAPCGGASCLTLSRTADGGYTWAEVAAPQASWPLAQVPEVDSGLTVRFADGADGWLVAPLCSSGGCSGADQLWATHDGAASWSRVTLPVSDGSPQVAALESLHGKVWAAVYGGQGQVELYSSPVDADQWALAATPVAIGAGPVPTSTLVLHGSSGWFVQDDRTVVGGATLDASGKWVSWTSVPCAGANGAASLAASASVDSPLELVALCQEGEWGPPNPAPAGGTFPSTWLYTSGDDGRSFQAVHQLPQALRGSTVVASPSPGAVFAATGGEAAAPSIYASFDGGSTWTSVYTGQAGDAVDYLGFTTATQGVAVVVETSGSAGPGGSMLLMTRDGGRSWAPVSFGV